MPYRAPEVWLYKKNRLMIYGLEGDSYVLKTNSRYFPNMNLSEVIAEGLKTTSERNTSTAIREFRRKLANSGETLT
ncbi:MAG: hypothetical protein ABI417_18295 [Coleofasciculaceae cyanobacterium]